MSDLIFAKAAPMFWSRDLKAVPLEPNSKRPAKELKSWQGHLAAVPNESHQKNWLEVYGQNGIGLLLGGECVSGYILVGLDVDDDRLAEPIVRFLRAKSGQIAGKKGKKGVTLFTLMPKGTRSTIIKGTDGLGNIDVLAGGKMTVMPPSIHPETLQAYVDWGDSLLKTPFEQLPHVSQDEVSALSVALGSEEILAILEGTATHEAGLSLVGRMVAKGAIDEEITAIVTAFLPDGYKGNALDELPGWISSAREKGFDQKPRKERDNQIGMLIDMAFAEGAELFNDGYGGAFATVSTADGLSTYILPSTAAKLWLRHRASSVLGKHIGSNPIAEAALALEAKALLESPTLPVFRRVAGELDRVELDFGRPDGSVVAINRDGWKVEAVPQFKFLRSSGLGALPDPVRGGDLRRLQDLLGLGDENFRLVLAFILNALKPSGPYFCLLVEGEQGSGKSFLTQVIKRIVDPNQAERLRLPDNDRDLMIQAKEFWLLNFDNASGMKADISDALCSLATGGGIAVRRLYTDGEMNVLSYARPFVINGISNFVSRPDLMERAIPLRLPPLPEGARKEEAVMLAEFSALLPGILGVLYDAVASALRRREEVSPPTNLRMADAARWILAGEEVFQLGGVSVLDTIVQAQDDLYIDQISGSPLLLKLKEVLVGGLFEGVVGELFQKMDAGRDPTLPKTPSHLSAALKRNRPALERVGVKVDFLERTKLGQPIRIAFTPKPNRITAKF